MSETDTHLVWCLTVGRHLISPLGVLQRVECGDVAFGSHLEVPAGQSQVSAVSAASVSRAAVNLKILKIGCFFLD